MDEYQLTIEVPQQPGHVLVTGKPAGTARATVPAPTSYSEADAASIKIRELFEQC